MRAPLMRSTLHLMTAEGYLHLWPAAQPALIRALGAFFGKKARGLAIDRLIAAARDHLDEGPQSFAALRAALSKLEPERDPEALAYAVRSYLPLVQVPPAGTWRSGGRVAYALAEQWLGRPLADSDNPRELVSRYLRAFGPGTVRDIQTWSGPAGGRERRAQAGAAHLPGRARQRATRPARHAAPAFRHPGSRAIPARVRQPGALPRRPDPVRARGAPQEGVPLGRAGTGDVPADGTVRGTWKIDKSHGVASLVVEPFDPLAEPEREALLEKSERLVRFVEDGAKALEVRFAAR